jgi:hypothetical protein
MVLYLRNNYIHATTNADWFMEKQTSKIGKNMSLKRQLPHIVGALIACSIVLMWTRFDSTNNGLYGAIVGIIAGTTWAMIVNIWKNRK